MVQRVIASSHMPCGVTEDMTQNDTYTDGSWHVGTRLTHALPTALVSNIYRPENCINCEWQRAMEAASLGSAPLVRFGYGFY